MKTIALVTNILALSTAGLFAQKAPSDYETLVARVNLNETKIKQLEIQLANYKSIQEVKSSAQPADTTTSAKTAKYTVVKGDSLSRIAKNHNTSISALKSANSLKSDNLSIGQKLTIPSKTTKTAEVKNTTAPAPAKKAIAKTSSPSKYKVKKGETFYSIARDHKVSLKSLIAANPTISPSRLSTGQTLVIDGNAVASKPKPVAKSTPKPAPTPKPVAKAKVKETVKETVSKKPSSSIRTITVNQQMTYSQFASKHGASTTQLNSLNGLSLANNTMLAKGSELYVPQY